MAALRHTAASMVAASAVMLIGQPGVATAEPVAASHGPEQGFRAAADIAADVYRDERRSVLNRYRRASREAQDVLGVSLLNAQTTAQRQAAWRGYKAATADLRAQSHAQLQRARQTFRATVTSARQQFGLEPAITASTFTAGYPSQAAVG